MATCLVVSAGLRPVAHHPVLGRRAEAADAQDGPETVAFGLRERPCPSAPPVDRLGVLCPLALPVRPHPLPEVPGPASPAEAVVRTGRCQTVALTGPGVQSAPFVAGVDTPGVFP